MNINEEINRIQSMMGLNESKQVGTLYHYTKFGPLKNIVDSGVLMGTPSLSFTRDKNFHKSYRDIGAGYGKGPLAVRLTVDGDKLSNRYKIEPHADIHYGKGTYDFEAEERIIPMRENEVVTVPIKDYVISIDFLTEPIDSWIIKNPLKYIEIFNQIKDMGIKINMVDENGNPIPRKELSKIQNWFRLQLSNLRKYI
jgi:hypothetical protein